MSKANNDTAYNDTSHLQISSHDRLRVTLQISSHDRLRVTLGQQIVGLIARSFISQNIKNIKTQMGNY